AALHATARSSFILGSWRAMLGLAEAGNFPAAIKGVAEWFPKRDRAFATGLFNSGATVSSIIGPPLFAWMVHDQGLNWRMCFIVTGILGFVWLALWWVMCRTPEKHTLVNKAELSYIRSDAADEAVEGQRNTIGWTEAFRHRETRGF